KAYLEERIATAHVAALALQATPDNMVSPELEAELLYHAGAYGVVLRHPTRHSLMLSKEMPPKVDVTFDLRAGSFPYWILDAYGAMFRDDNRIMRVIGMSPKQPGVIVEAVLDEAPMRHEMLAFSNRILQLSVIISLLTAGLVYLSLHRLLVRPMRRITRSMIRFRENPEDTSRTIAPSERSDEIGIAERELTFMQDEVRSALNQRSRLAALGAAVAKINHDLRNSLATAVLVSDRLANIDDPEVKKVTPRLYNAIDKAVLLCSQTLNYAGGGGITLDPALFHLSELIAEVAVGTRRPATDDAAAFDVISEVAFEVDLTADRGHLYRVFENLVLNARNAGATQVVIAAKKLDGRILIDVRDDGPGLPPSALESLFEPFTGSGRDGGSGLGLAISRDITQAHGGELTLLETGESGTTFRLDLPS
ncbi:MAG: HAMP domain-containing histidine kinase, partial [Rhodospirillaceae bacterium]|nr:HAMP domain-containing histidine kinase [Rhodospirillaceae bacterium]